MTGWKYNSQDEGMCNYAINSVLFLTTVREKYVKMYERFIEELKLYSKAIRVLSKGYLPISLLPPSKLEKILKEERIAIAKSNKDYDLVLARLYLYSDMKLVTFGRQPKEFDCTIPCICATLHSEKIDYVSNQNSSGTYFR